MTQVAAQSGLPDYPRLRENVWYIDPEQDDALLVTGKGRFAIPVREALRFLDMRPHCTGQLSLEEVSRRSGCPPEEVCAALGALSEAGALYVDLAEAPAPTLDAVREKLLAACAIWHEELRFTNIHNAFAFGAVPTTTLLGWTIERYHLSRALPDLVATAARRATGELGPLLARYAEQQRGHSAQYVRLIENLGVSQQALMQSVPFVTTRALISMQRHLFELEPFTILLLETVSSALILSEEQIAAIEARCSAHFGLEPRLLVPWFDLARTQAAENQGDWATQHQELLLMVEPRTLDTICTELHEIRHAFDVLALEVRDYYDRLNGKYIPRQCVSFASL